MKRYIVLGVNENPVYLYYLPLVLWGWERLGWWPIIFYAGPETKVSKFVFNDREGFVYDVGPIDGYKSETLAQMSRLYGALTVNNDNDLLMTSDCDMLALSNYWVPSDLNISCYGRDLTDYHYPICYCAMTARKWIEVMLMMDMDPTVCIKQDLYERPKNSNSWLWDQDVLTERLNGYGKRLLTLIPRGTDKRTGYPIGRIDRSHWTLDHSKYIDAHLPHDILTNDESFRKVMQLLHHVWPKEDFKWMLEYHREFKKLL